MLCYIISWPFAVVKHEQTENLMSSIVAYIATRLKISENENYSIIYRRAMQKEMRRKGEELIGVKLLHDLFNCCLQRENSIPKVSRDIGSVFELRVDNILKVVHPSF